MQAVPGRRRTKAEMCFIFATPVPESRFEASILDLPADELRAGSATWSGCVASENRLFSMHSLAAWRTRCVDEVIGTGGYVVIRRTCDDLVSMDMSCMNVGKWN